MAGIKNPKILLVYPNLPLMMAPSIAMGIFTAIAKQEGCEVDIFETTQYSDAYSNRHIRMTEIGANRPNKDEEVKDMFFIQSQDRIFPDFIKKVEEYKPDLILMSVQEDVWKMARNLLEKIHDKNIPHILGGIFCTSAPEIALSSPYVKVVARHEGERTVLQAINCLKEGKPITDIDGIWYKDENDKIVKKPPQKLCDITQITPDFSCFGAYRWQRPMGGRVFKRAVSMETYRGCPYNCTYCNSPFSRNFEKDTLGVFLRRKPADIIERDLKYYIDQYNPDLIMFQDDSFLARPKKEIFEFCEMWSKYKIPFWFNTRIENCKPEILAALKEAGVYRMTFGLESGNEQYRKDILKRGVKNSVYLEHFDYINESNIPYSLNVIIGMPFETRQMVLESAEMVHASRGYDGLTIGMLQLYHGTDLRRLAAENGFIPKDFINSEGSTEQGGGYLDDWHLKMPKPYLQLDEVKALVKTFALYAFFEKDRWPEIQAAETDDVLYEKLMDEYQSKFFADIQQGGADRIKSLYCGQHDATSTYKFNTV